MKDKIVTCTAGVLTDKTNSSKKCDSKNKRRLESTHGNDLIRYWEKLVRSETCLLHFKDACSELQLKDELNRTLVGILAVRHSQKWHEDNTGAISFYF